RRDAQRLNEEILIMRMLDHPNTVQLFETFEDEGNVYLVMELCSGGELLGYILNSGFHTESLAASIMSQVFQAVKYMHSVRVCHRDLKHSNTLLLSQAPFRENCVKIVDFGLACRFEPHEPMRQCAGTAIYVAPQVLECKYYHHVDLWSCGVLLYILLCGYPPFRGDTDAAIMTAIRRGNYSFPSSDWSFVSEDAKSLIRSLLKMKVKERITVENALQHRWIKEPKGEEILSKALERMRRFIAHQQKTQDLNPEQDAGSPLGEGLGTMGSQSSIATRIPQAGGFWFKDLQNQWAALTAAVGSVMSGSKKAGVAPLPEAQDLAPIGKLLEKELSPSQCFRHKHVEEEMSPSAVFKKKHVEEIVPEFAAANAVLEE
ncbi:unnamed protein product, partial [Effrenium voratum]